MKLTQITVTVLALAKCCEKVQESLDSLPLALVAVGACSKEDNSEVTWAEWQRNHAKWTSNGGPADRTGAQTRFIWKQAVLHSILAIDENENFN